MDCVWVVVVVKEDAVSYRNAVEIVTLRLRNLDVDHDRPSPNPSPRTTEEHGLVGQIA